MVVVGTPKDLRIIHVPEGLEMTPFQLGKNEKFDYFMNLRYVRFCVKIIV